MRGSFFSTLALVAVVGIAAVWMAGSSASGTPPPKSTPSLTRPPSSGFNIKIPNFGTPSRPPTGITLPGAIGTRPPSSGHSHPPSTGSTVIPIPIPIPYPRPRPPTTIIVPNTVPQYVPSTPQYVPSAPQYVPNVIQPTLPANPTVQPNIAPLPNVLPPPTVQPLSNTGFLGTVQKVTQQDIQQMQRQAQAKNGKLAGNLAQQVQKGLEEDLTNLPGFQDLTEQQKQQIRDAVRSGAALAALLSDAQINSPAGRRLAARAAAFLAINGLRQKADAGTLVVADLTDAAARIRLVVQVGTADAQLVDASLGALLYASELIRILLTAVPGYDVIPAGNDVTIALVPGLAAGVVIPLGNATALVGQGCVPCDLVVGTGSVAAAAGAAVAIGSPVPESDAQDVASGVVIRNPKTNPSLGYNLNSQQFTIGAGYVQTLPTGQTWVVEFDRGGSHGTGKYGLTSGTYDFTPTQDHGWELFQQTFKLTLDNSQNRAEFHFVLNNAAQVVGPRQKLEFTSEFPLVVRFDNGNKEVKQKTLESGTYKVAVTSENTLDLFAPEAVAPPVAAGGLPPGLKLFANPFMTTPKLAFGTTPAGSGSGVSLFGPEASTQ